MNNSHIVARNVGKSFGKHAVLANVSFDVRPGDIVGVLGKNGAGKTTLLEMMLGFTPLTSGTLETLGYDSFRLPAGAKSRLGFVPQQDELIDQLRAIDQLQMISSFYSQWDRALIERLSGRWELDLEQRIGRMSVGQRQKLSILLALGHHPDLLILDEPVASLDPLSRRQFLEQIIEIAADGSRSVVFSTHIVSDVERLANRIWILKDANLFWSGDLDSLKESIVRVHIRNAAGLADTAIPNALFVRRDAAHITAVVRDWGEQELLQVVERVRAEPVIEQLSLEDIFLELHR